MKKAKRASEGGSAIAPVKTEIRNLLTMFEFFMTQRQLGKPISVLAESVHDMRLILGRLLLDHFMGLTPAASERFCKALASMLADACASLEEELTTDGEYCRYCIGEILTPFEYAQEIKKQFANDSILQKMLSMDIPILRPFDYGMRGKLRVLTPQKRRRVHR